MCFGAAITKERPCAPTTSRGAELDISVRSLGHRDMSGFEKIFLSKERLVGADFSGRRPDMFASAGSRFEDCRFDGMVCDDAAFGAGRITSEYIGCSFDGAILTMGPGGYARFVDCSFENVKIDRWYCEAVELVNCTFSGRLKTVVFNGTLPRHERETIHREANQFEGNDFSLAKLIDVGFQTGIDLGKQKLPSGEDYAYLEDAQTAVRRARAAFEEWDEDARKQAYGVLAVMEDQVAAGQHQLLICLTGTPRSRRPHIEALMNAAQGE